MQQLTDNVLVDFDFSLGLNLELYPDLFSLEVLDACFQVELQGFGELGNVHVHSLLHLSRCFVSYKCCTVFDINNVKHKFDCVILQFFIRLVLDRRVSNCALGSSEVFKWSYKWFLEVLQNHLIKLADFNMGRARWLHELGTFAIV
jgi:hypothetical protein